MPFTRRPYNKLRRFVRARRTTARTTRRAGGNVKSYGTMARYARKAYRYGRRAVSGYANQYGTQRAITKIGQIAKQYPQLKYHKDYVEITHREYLGDVISSSVAGAFRIDDYAINVGVVSTFPWLSDVVGTTFQTYQPEAVIFQFKSFSSDALNSTNTALGAVICAVNYDSSDSTFTNRNEMENTDNSFSAKPSANFDVPISTARKNNPLKTLYIRSGAVPSGADIKMYDLARFSIASLGCQGTSVNLGSLYVVYKIKVFKPVILTPGVQLPAMKMRCGGTVNVTNKFGTVQIFDINTMGATQLSNVLTFDRKLLKQGQTFMFTWAYQGTGAQATPTFAFVGFTAKLWFTNNTQSLFSITDNSTATSTSICVEVNQAGTQADPTITASGGTFATFSALDVSMLMINGFDF